MKDETRIGIAALARRLGVQNYQVRHLMVTQRIPAPVPDPHRPYWTAEQVQRITEWHRHWVETDRGCRT